MIARQLAGNGARIAVVGSIVAGAPRVAQLELEVDVVRGPADKPRDGTAKRVCARPVYKDGAVGGVGADFRPVLKLETPPKEKARRWPNGAS